MAHPPRSGTWWRGHSPRCGGTSAARTDRKYSLKTYQSGHWQQCNLDKCETPGCLVFRNFGVAGCRGTRVLVAAWCARDRRRGYFSLHVMFRGGWRRARPARDAGFDAIRPRAALLRGRPPGFPSLPGGPFVSPRWHLWVAKNPLDGTFEWQRGRDQDRLRGHARQLAPRRDHRPDFRRLPGQPSPPANPGRPGSLARSSRITAKHQRCQST
jgi:hypothetical protein